MSLRWKGGFIQLFFDPLTPGPTNEFGPLYAWGLGTSGQLGDGSVVSRSSPVQIGSETNWSKLSAGQTTPLFVKTDGTLWAVGKNNFGQVGDGTVVDKSSPVQIGALTNWLNVASGGYRGSAIKQDGTIWTWGSNSRGQLGINASTTTYRSSPVQVGSLTTWAKLYASQGNNFAIKTDGTLWAWGLNTYGNLGDGTVVDRSSPVQIGALTDWSSIAVSNESAFGIKTGGTLWSWGRNDYGQLGTNTSYLINKSSPTQIGALTNWSIVSSGGVNSVFAIKTDGTLWCWGRNLSGGLGQNDTVNRSSPVQIGALTTWANVSAGTSTYAIKTDGTLWSWGQNTFGQLGAGDVISRSSPVQVGALTNWINVNSYSGAVFGVTEA